MYRDKMFRTVILEAESMQLVGKETGLLINLYDTQSDCKTLQFNVLE